MGDKRQTNDNMAERKGERCDVRRATVLLNLFPSPNSLCHKADNASRREAVTSAFPSMMYQILSHHRLEDSVHMGFHASVFIALYSTRRLKPPRDLGEHVLDKDMRYLDR